MPAPRILSDITILKSNPASLGPKALVLFMELSSPPQLAQVIQMIAGSTNTPIFLVQWKEGTKEAQAMFTFLAKYCPMYQITSKWKLFALSNGNLERIFGHPKSEPEVKEIINYANSSSTSMVQSRSYAQPPPQHAGMSLSTGSSAQQIQILPDKRLSEPEQFIPYNQEWRKYTQ